MVDLRYFVATFGAIEHPKLTLVFNKDTFEMPGADGDFAAGTPEINPYCLVIDKSGCFDVVSYLYRGNVGDLENVRHFTNGDVPRPETDFIAWALLPDLN